MEGGVYLCNWKRQRGRVVVWCLDDPTLEATGEDLEAAEEELCGLICERLGDGEAVIELVRERPVPMTELAPYASPSLYTVAGNGWATVENKDELYSGGICTLCSQPVGSRTPVTLVTSEIEPGDGAIAHRFRGFLYSEGFLASLGADALRGIELRQVATPTRTRKRYFELVGPSMLTRRAVEGFPGLSGGRCPECGLTIFSYLHRNQVVDFVEREALAALGRECVTVGTALGPVLCLTGTLWGAVKAGARNVAGSRIYAVPRSAVLEPLQLEEWDRALFTRS